MLSAIVIQETPLSLLVYSQEVAHEAGISENAAGEWCDRLRDVAAFVMYEKTEPIGGPDMTAEVDETYFKGLKIL